MDAIQSYLKEQHASCDALFVALESAVAERNWDRAKGDWDRFVADLHRHFTIEEEVLFPEIEQETGMTNGPTEVMRCDHEQMRALLTPLGKALTDRDPDVFLGFAETMMVLIQQHNLKEEQVLYPMADNVVTNAGTLVDSMRSYTACADA